MATINAMTLSTSTVTVGGKENTKRAMEPSWEVPKAKRVVMELQTEKLQTKDSPASPLTREEYGSVLKRVIFALGVESKQRTEESISVKQGVIAYLTAAPIDSKLKSRCRGSYLRNPTGMAQNQGATTGL
mmetsp:Transcript_21835/g.53999  ORF Transcript_21835/g.53999 Transcript_21835/m.53999 type:complete len:130 (+) Transcript_21835:421-810(+)